MSKQQQVTMVSAKHGVKLANNNLTLPVIGVAQLDHQGHLLVDVDKVDALVQATKDSIALVPVESKAAGQGEAMAELEQALRGTDTKTLLELVKESNLNIVPEKLANMSNEKLIQLLVKQAQDLQTREQFPTNVEGSPEFNKANTLVDKEKGAGDDYPVQEKTPSFGKAAGKAQV